MVFDPTNRAHKKQLYPVLRAISDVDPRMSPEILLDKACGQPIQRGTDYIKNVAKGDFAKSIAQLVYEYLRDHHFDIAHKTSADIFPESPEMRWRQVLDERATTDHLSVVLVKSTMGLVTRESDHSAVDHTIAFGQRFLFELIVAEPCYCIGLQGLGDRWYPIKLGEKERGVWLDVGTSRLPRFDNGLPDPLLEETHGGLHDFVFVTSSTSGIQFEINNLLSWVSDNMCDLHSMQIRFVA